MEGDQIVAFGDVVLNGVNFCSSEFFFVLPPELLRVGALQTAGLDLRETHDPEQIADRRSFQKVPHFVVSDDWNTSWTSRASKRR